MFLTCLSNKKSPAPVAYIVLHFSLVAAYVVIFPETVDIHKEPLYILFWLSGIITILFYFYTHLRDPGFVNTDDIVLSDDLNSGENAYPVKKRTSSAGHSKFIQSPNLWRRKNKESISEAINKPDEDEKDLEIKKRPSEGANSMVTSAQLFTHIPTEITVNNTKKKEESNRIDTDFVDTEPNNNIHGLEIEDEEAEKDIDLVECEPSMEQGEESVVPENMINFEEASKGDLENMNLSLAVKSRTSSAKNTIKMDGLDVSKGEDNLKNHNKIENILKRKGKKGLTQVGDLALTNDILHKSAQVQTCKDSPLYNLEMTKQSSVENYTRKDELNESFGNEIKIRNVSKEKFRRGLSKAKFENDIKIEIPSLQKDDFPKGSARELLSDDQYSRGSPVKKKKIRKDSLGIKSPVSSRPTDLDDDEIYVERRYCTVCNLEQLLRSKHCKDCNRCIAQYDHHCPWLGTCIGERNHRSFYWFLVFQLTELIWGAYKVLSNIIITEEELPYKIVIRLTLAILLVFIVIMVCSLLCLHSYLAINNLTTWETFSWYKISYLKEWDEELGSPFDKGCIQNIRLFCCYRQRKLIDWQMPKYRPSSITKPQPEYDE